MLNTENYWLYIEPYVHISFKAKNILMYNTLSQEYIEIKENDKVRIIIEQLLIPDNFWCIYLSGKELKDDNISKFINNLREFYIGDIIDISYSKCKPVQFIPKLNNQRNIDILKKVPNRSIGEDELNLLSEITFQINDHCNLSCNLCNHTYKQTLFCTKNSKISEIKIDQIRNILDNLKRSGLQRVNITGGNIFLYTFLNDLIELLNDSLLMFFFHIQLINLIENIHLFNQISKIKSLTINILVNSVENMKEIETIIPIINSSQIEHYFTFIIQNENQFNEIEKIISELNICNYRFCPIYTKQDFEFFKTTSFLSKNDIISNKISQKDIHRNMEINTNDFGKLYVSSNGNIYANINHVQLGTVKNDIRELIYNELNIGKSWRRIRNMKPCCNCIYQWLCPSPSNYDLVIGKPNLCHVKSF